MVSFFEDGEVQVVPLITCENGNYSVCDSTLEWLVANMDSVYIIACGGKYRTGKSFLLNRLAKAHSNTGFGVGDTVQACTKGLWIYKQVFEHKGKKIVFMDTEGIDALDANDTHDVRIFSLALLLSSSFLYNSMGAIDETSIQTLSLMTRVTQNVRFDTDDDPSAKMLAPHMPKFYWVLRDFNLKLTDKNNQAISEQEYLEQALALTNDPNKNSVREAIRDSFATRYLTKLPQPSNTMDNSVRMEDRLMSLSKAFVQTVDKLRNRLFDDIEAVSANSTPLTGKMYAELCRHYTAVIQSNAVPVIKDSWTLMASIQARDLKDELLAECGRSLAKLTPNIRKVLEDDMQALSTRLMDAFHQKSMKPINKEVEAALQQQISEQCENTLQKLEINIGLLVDTSINCLEEKIAQNPLEMNVILNDSMVDFSKEHDYDPEFVKAWKSAAIDRCLCRWIPQLLQSCQHEKTLMEERLLTSTNDYESRLASQQEQFDTQIEEEKNRAKELELSHESHLQSSHLEKENTMRLHAELFIAWKELRSTEHLKANIIADEEDIVEVNNDVRTANDIQDELSTCLIENAELKASLCKEETDHAKCKRSLNEVKENHDRLLEKHKQMEKTWNRGIQTLKDEQSKSLKKLQASFDSQIEHLSAKNKDLTAQFDQEQIAHAELKTQHDMLSQKYEQECKKNESATKTLEENIQKYRDSSEKASNRVLEIHKSMLEDLRVRDERARDQQVKFMKESSELQTKISELTRNLDHKKDELTQSKRKLGQLETIEIECKRMKTSEREKEILITQLQSENKELRETTRECLSERDAMRKENMQMEAELSVLRTERDMRNVKELIDGESK